MRRKLFGLRIRIELVVINEGSLKLQMGIRRTPVGSLQSETVQIGRFLTPICFSCARLIKRLKLRRPVYLQTAAYGHFGRTGDGFTWEELDLVKKLQRAAK